MKYYLTTLAFAITCIALAQQPAYEPIYVLDSIKAKPDTFKTINPKDISTVSVIKDATAIELLGKEGTNGIIYIETKTFAKKRFWKYFSKKSGDYKATFPTLNSDTSAAYIINGDYVAENYEGDLASITDKNLISIKVIDKKELKKYYKVSDKEYGVIVDFVRAR